VYTPGNVRTTDGQPGFVKLFDSSAPPIDYELAYVTPEFYEFVAAETTRYDASMTKYDEAKVANGGGNPTTPTFNQFRLVGFIFRKEHIMAWRAVRMVMYGIHGIKYNFRNCWSEDDIYAVPIVKEFMARDMFIALNTFMHFEDLDNENPYDITWKYRDAVAMLKEIVYQSAYQMEQDLSVDEGVCDTSSKKVRIKR
jgi:hypothetical protein